MTAFLATVPWRRGLIAACLAVFPMWVASAAELHKLVVHVPQDDPKSLVQALNIASNVQKELGMDKVHIEVVAQGPGLKLLTTESPHAERVQSLAMHDITFSACGNTMAAIARKAGKEPQLLEGVGKVKAGILRVMELQQQGYSYVRP